MFSQMFVILSLNGPGHNTSLPPGTRSAYNTTPAPPPPPPTRPGQVTTPPSPPGTGSGYNTPLLPPWDQVRLQHPLLSPGTRSGYNTPPRDQVRLQHPLPPGTKSGYNTPPPPPRDCGQAGGTHPTGMHSCWTMLRFGDIAKTYERILSNHVGNYVAMVWRDQLLCLCYTTYYGHSTCVC